MLKLPCTKEFHYRLIKYCLCHFLRLFLSFSPTGPLSDLVFYRRFAVPLIYSLRGYIRPFQEWRRRITFDLFIEAKNSNNLLFTWVIDKNRLENGRAHFQEGTGAFIEFLWQWIILYEKGFVSKRAKDVANLRSLREREGRLVMCLCCASKLRYSVPVVRCAALESPWNTKVLYLQQQRFDEFFVPIYTHCAFVSSSIFLSG